jgi:hypothetical protein
MRQDDATSLNGFGRATFSRAKSTNVLLSDERFQSILWLENKRSERNRKHLLLMLIDHGNSCEQPSRCRSLIQAAGALSSTIRETDIAGWFDANCVLGVIFTEFGHSDVTLATEAIRIKITKSLQRSLTPQQLNRFHLSFYAFPDQRPENERETARVRHPIAEPSVNGNELLVGNPAVLALPSRVAELCSPSQRLRLE